MYINDIFDDLPEQVHFSLYADDGAFWVVNETLECAIETAQTALNKITDWSRKWGLSLSPQKTNCVIFSLRQAKNPTQLKLINYPINTICCNYKISRGHF